MGMDADSGIEPRESLGELERAVARRDVPARDEDSLDAGQASATDHEVEVRLESIGLEVAVRIDEAHRQIVADAPRG